MNETRCGQPTKSGPPCRSILKPGQVQCVAHAAAGKRPRGRCPECGKEYALNSDGTMFGHGGAYENGRYQSCGQGSKPMSAEQCERWDEAERIKQEARAAEWRAQQEREEDARDREFAASGGFRRMDEDSFAACPWRSDRVAFIAIGPDGPRTFGYRPDHKRALLRSELTILVAWPGEWSQHIFLLTDDDKRAVLRSFGYGRVL